MSGGKKHNLTIITVIQNCYHLTLRLLFHVQRHRNVLKVWFKKKWLKVFLKSTEISAGASNVEYFPRLLLTKPSPE